MNTIIFHIDFNSYFATVEQQANPRLRGKPIGVTGGDKNPYRSRSEDSITLAHGTLPSPNGERRLERTVLGAASVEAKKFGVKTGMPIWQAKKLCPQIILVAGDSDKYLETTKRFLNILKDYSSYIEVFSIDEVFMKMEDYHVASLLGMTKRIAQEIKSRIKIEIGEVVTCSIGISYNKLMAKLAGSLQKPDGLVVIANQEEAIKILDKIELDEVCGIGARIKSRLNNLGVFNFGKLRQVPQAALLASFKSYGQVLYNMAQGIDNSAVVPFWEKEEVKSIGHRHTIDHDTANPTEIKQILLKLAELVARRLRAKKLTGKTVHSWYRQAIPTLEVGMELHLGFEGDRIQTTIFYTNDGIEIFKAAWKIFHQIWNQEKIRMIGVSVSNLKPKTPQNLSLLPENSKQEAILETLDKINDKFGEFTLQRAILLDSIGMQRKPNPFLSDRRFKI
ncbi:DNA polymerase IV [Candidatus Daviesbacteria bacterium]|nr:DNA polymerase IV [Candidatus Daviesbacteria bacterium]